MLPERKQEPKWKELHVKEEEFHTGKIESSLSRLMELLQEANKRPDGAVDGLDTSHRKYRKLHAEYMALKYGDICDMSQVSDATPPEKLPKVLKES